MSTATWIQHELEHAGIHFQELHHDDAFTAQALAECEHISGHRVAKVVVVIADDRPIELILPASRRVNLDMVRRLLPNAENVRLADEIELRQYFADCEAGGIPPLRHWKDVEVIMDGTLHVDGDIVFPAGTRRDAVCISFDEWFQMVNPRVEFFTEPARAFMPDDVVEEWRHGECGEWD
jgi:Ala-tRNA(Pro) deacylase